MVVIVLWFALVGLVVVDVGNLRFAGVYCWLLGRLWNGCDWLVGCSVPHCLGFGFGGLLPLFSLIALLVEWFVACCVLF